MSSNVLIVVDNTDPGIVYTGPTDRDRPWFNLPIVTDPIGNYGQPYNLTSQGQPFGGTIVYEFEGTEITAYAGRNVFEMVNGAVNPSWRCFVDDARLALVDPWSINNLANQVLCDAQNLSEGKHTFRLELTITETHTFYFDRFEYRPLQSASLADKNVRVDDTHPSFLFHGGGWEGLRDQAHGTRTAGSYIDFSFTGTALTWYGLIPSNGSPTTPAEATYQLDDGQETTFPLYGLNGTNIGVPDYFYQIFFKLSSLSAGDHKIRVTHKGDSNRTPLTLDFVVVEQGGPRAATTTSPPTTSSTPADNNTPDTTSTKPPIGAIVGATIAAVALVAALVFGFFILRKRRRKAAANKFTLSPEDEDEGTHIGTPVDDTYQPTQTGKRPLIISSLTTASSSTETRPLSSEKRALAVPTTPSSTLPSASTAPSSVRNTDTVPPLSPPPLPTDLAHSPGPENQLLADNSQSNLPPDADGPLPPSRIVQHQDSGLRLPGADRSSVVELPPQYTPV